MTIPDDQLSDDPEVTLAMRTGFGRNKQKEPITAKILVTTEVSNVFKLDRYEGVMTIDEALTWAKEQMSELLGEIVCDTMQAEIM